MTSTTFVDKVTVILPAWLNDVNTAVYSASSGISGASVRTAVAKNADYVSVKDYGAVGNGTTDDTAAINAVLLYASTVGLAVYFPRGTYKTTSPLLTFSNVTMFGDGDGASIIHKTTNTNGTGTSRARGGTVTDSYVVDSIISVWHTDSAGTTIYAQNVHIEGLQLSGTGNTYGIYAPRMSMSSIRHVYYNNVVAGYYTRDTWQTTHERCTAQGHTYGWRYVDDGSGLGAGTSCTFINCWNNCDNSVRNPAGPFDIFGLTYSTFINGAVDNCTRTDTTVVYGYNFNTCRGITLIGCGMELSAAGIISALSSRLTILNMRSFQMSGNAGWGTIGGILNDASVIAFRECDFDVYGTPGTILNQIIQNGGQQSEENSVMPTGGSTFISYGGGSSRVVQTPSQTTVYDATGIRLVVPQLATVLYSASMTPSYALGNEFVITATNNTPFTINAIGGSPGTGALATITIRNTSGGNTGAATWDVVFKLAAWAVIATLLSRSITFRYNGTNWVEISRTPTDVPN